MRAAKCRPQRGVQRGLPLALLGNFQRYGVLRLGKFPNKLRYFLRKYPAACRRSFGGGSPCRLLTRITPPYYFPLSVSGGWRGNRFRFQRLLCTAQPPDLAADGKPRACFAFVNGNDCSAFLRSGNSPFPSV